MLNIYLETDVTYLDPRVKGHFALHNHINGISVLKKRFQESETLQGI